MKLQYDKQIDNNILTSIVMFKEYGTPLLTPEMEKSYVKDYSPKFEYKDLQFKRYMKVVNGDVVEDKGVTNYTNNLSIVLPTNVIANPVTAGTANVTIGSKVIAITIADVTNGIATSNEIESAILNSVKTDASILALFSASDISVIGGHVVGTKVVTTDSTSLVSTINTVFGVGSVVMTNTTTYTGVQVEFVLNNKVVVIDETLAEKISFNVSDVLNSELNSVLTTKELVTQCKCELYRVVIKDAVKSKLEELRLKVNNFSGETIETL
jgi:hypothetical protein